MKPLDIRTEDIDDACQFVVESELGDGDAFSLCASDLKLLEIASVPPEELIDMSLFGPANPPGWICSLPQEEWLSQIESESSRSAELLLKYYREAGGVPPAITIDGHFGDGRLRSFFAHALGVEVPVARYVIADQQKRRLFRRLRSQK